METRKLKEEEYQAALQLALDVFMQFEADNEARAESKLACPLNNHCNELLKKNHYEKRSQSSGNRQKQCLQAMDVIAHAYGNPGKDNGCKQANKIQ